MPFTEFFVQPTASNLNAGSTSADAASRTYASGSWVAATGVFTPASGNPSSDGVLVGDFASVYPDGSSSAVFVGRVTAVSSTTITVSLTAKAGAAPADGTNTRTLKIGGAWQGPNGAVGFPFGFVGAALTNAAGDRLRINLRAGTAYAITAAMTHSNAGPTRFQGYTSSPGDGGRAIIDGGTSGASYILLTLSGSNCELVDVELKNNGATGSASGLLIQSNPITLIGVVVHDVRGSGIRTGTTSQYVLMECEAYSCDLSNTSNLAGYEVQSTCLLLRCVAHNNTQSNCHGIIIGSGPVLASHCIAGRNGGHGIFASSSGGFILLTNCDMWDNGSRGISSSSGSAQFKTLLFDSCNISRNAQGGIDASGPAIITGRIVNCGFGSGSEANGGTGDIQSNAALLELVNKITYPSGASPWVDAVNGDWRISLHEAKRSGRGVFTLTRPGSAGAVGYPDIGAAQAYATGAVRMEGSEE